jgi:hypothetical protein
MHHQAHAISRTDRLFLCQKPVDCDVSIHLPCALERVGELMTELLEA